MQDVAITVFLITVFFLVLPDNLSVVESENYVDPVILEDTELDNEKLAEV